MTSIDVRSILNLPNNATASSSSAPRRSAAPIRKPDGLPRELYALIGDNAPFLAEAQASLEAVRYRHRQKDKAPPVKWRQAEFVPAARKQFPARLRHWIKADEDVDKRSAYFDQFDQASSVMEYSQYEYEQHLVDKDWTPHETAYLFELLRAYDLRFIVIADRYEYLGPKGEGPAKHRSVEEIKDRYHSICRRLIKTRTASDPRLQQGLLDAHSFEKDREVKRKQYASELFHLTSAEIAEEEALFLEVKRMEQMQKRYSMDRDELLRNIAGMESGLVNIDTSGGEGLPFDRHRRKRPLMEGVDEESATPDDKKAKKTTQYDAVRCIYRLPSSDASFSQAPKHAVHGAAFLRSSKLPVPKANATIRITDILAELGISTERLVMPTRININMLEQVFNAAASVIEMKRQVDRVEQELRTLRAQGEGRSVEPALKRSGRSESVASTDTTGTNRRARAM